ncbi:MAG: sporulation transcriptional regulator SpoIIID [Firmicutes bacterium]|nr:sporulation transcriptional regulator SpoIIID [Bacillota bacterium]
MKQHIVLRSIKLADYLLQTRQTVREAAKQFGYSKSTVHKDVAERLADIDLEKFHQVKEVLEFNLSERHIRGGTATKEKYRILRV